MFPNEFAHNTDRLPPDLLKPLKLRARQSSIHRWGSLSWPAQQPGPSPPRCWSVVASLTQDLQVVDSASTDSTECPSFPVCPPKKHSRSDFHVHFVIHDFRPTSQITFENPECRDTSSTAQLSFQIKCVQMESDKCAHKCVCNDNTWEMCSCHEQDSAWQHDTM